jgi:hypothetical protein
MRTGLQARIYDPLWLLTRQWQLGEFEGEDNGSPVSALFRADAAKVSRFHAGALPRNTPAVAAAPYDAAKTPLETLVERERVRTPQPSEKKEFAIEAGLHFGRALEQQRVPGYRDAFVREYALSALSGDERTALDADAVAFLDLMAGRALDGRKLYELLKLNQTGHFDLPSTLQIAPVDVTAVERALTVWRRWYESLFDEPSVNDSCWIPERMEYAFSVAGKLPAGEVVLTAEEYSHGNLDWYDFDGNINVSLGAAQDNVITKIRETTIPTPVTFRGAPANRFWEFEDAQVDFGSIEANPEDLARMLLVEFATTYGNDWFLIPVDLPVGSVCRSQPLIVTNTFGERFLIPPSQKAGAPFSGWRMFQHSTTQASVSEPTVSDAFTFFLPPVLINRLEGRPIEEVLFLRDEMANIAWAVEHVIESAIERPLNRSLPPPTNTPDANAADGLPRYRLTTTVPENWIPLAPVRSDKNLFLRRASVNLLGSPEFVSAKGRILNPEGRDPNNVLIFEEEVPREGLRVTRNYQLARWLSGSTHLWLGRKKKVGCGEGASNLRFDRLE